MNVHGDYTDLASEFTVPETPAGLQARLIGDEVHLDWQYPEGNTHDSFLVQWSADGESDWARVANSPPNNGVFSFEAPANPHWVPYNPPERIDGQHDSGYYRIIATNGDKVSESSNVAMVVPGDC